MRTVHLSWLFVMALFLGASGLSGCGTPEAAPCPEGRELKDGFCAALTCDAGQRVIDGACVPITCPPGTTLEGDTCTSDDTTAPSSTATPAGGTYSGAVTVQIVADEPAVIFYSTDGTTPDRSSESGPSPLTVTVDATADLRFFAVDAAGNEEGVNSESYTVDATGPDDITGMTTTVGPPDVTVDWTNPADLTGVLLVRGRAAPFGWQPENGVDYTAGQVVAPGVVVIDTGNTNTSFNDTTPWGDINTYAAWAYDDVFNYSANPATSELQLPVPPQSLTLEVDLSNGTVEFDQPQDMLVSLGAEVSSTLDELSLDFTIENLTPSPMYSIKAVFPSVSTGTVEDAEPYDGDPAVYLSPNAVPAGATQTGAAKIVGIPGGTGSLTIEVELITHPLMITAGQKYGEMIAMHDTSFGPFGGTGESDWFVGYPPSQNGPRQMILSAALAPDGLTLYATNFNTTRVKIFDLVTMTETMTSAVLGGVDTPPTGVLRMALSPDGQFVYVTLTTAIHGGRTLSGCTRRPAGSCPNASVVLVKLNAGDLTEVDRVTLASNIDNTVAPSVVGMTPSVSPDGTRVAVALDRLGQLAFVNAETMVELWTINTTNNRPRWTAVAPDNSFVYVMNKDAEISRVNTSNQLETVVPNTGFTSTSDGGGMVWGPDGLLYVARYRTDGATAGLVRINHDTLDTEVALVGRDIVGVGFQGTDRMLVADDDLPGVRVMGIGGASFTDIEQRTGQVTDIRGHFALVTPTPLWHPN